jgi:LPXTG-site transpeptidase (sortase) family protein
MIRSVRSFLTALLLALSLLVVQVSPARAASLPAEINKQFTPLQIDAGGVSVMRVTIFNPNTFQLTDADWTDNLISVQPGLYIANPAGVVNTCGGMVIATPGGTTLSLGGALANDGGTVPAQVGSTPGECYVEVNVSSVTPGNLINTIPASNLDAQGNDSGTSVDITNTTPASATITVTQVLNPSLSKLFVPSTIFVGENSQLTIRLNNNDSDTSLTGASYTDTLPAGLQIATPNGLTVTNCGSGTATAPAGGTVISLSAATVTPAQDCLVQVNVTGASGAYLIANSTANTIPAGPGGPGSLQTNQGVTNITPAQGEITIQPISVQKAFAPDPVDAGDTSILTITLENPTGAAYTGVAINDDLTTMGAGFTIGGAPTSNTCGFTVNAPVAGTLIQLTDGTIPASATPPTPRGTCTFSIPVQTSLTSTGGTSANNTIPAGVLTATQPVTNFLPATDNLTVNRALVGTKAYSPTSMLLGGTSQVTITLTNRSSTPITGVNFTDTLAPNLTVSGTPLTPQCGGAISNAANSVTLTGGTIPANGNCTIVFNVTSSTAGTYDNAVAANSITNTQGIGHAAFSTNPDLVVVNSGSLPVGLTKTFQTDPIVLGQFSRLRIRITAPVDTFISGINITDNLPAGLVIAPYPPATAPTDTCPGGTLTAVAGTSVITFTNTTAVADRLAAGTSCDIDVRVTSTTPGLYTNTIPVGAGGITTFEGRSNITPATDTITVTGMTTSKAFSPAYVQAGGRSTVTLTLFNTSSVPMTNVSVTDTMPGTATDGIRLAAVPNAITTCGGTLTAAPGSNIVTLTGGTILAGSIATPSLCTITFDVVGLDSTPGTPSTQTNTLVRTDVDALIGSTGVATEPFADSSATLNIQDLSMGVVKGFNPVLVYGGAYSTMSVELINPNLNAPLTGIAFTDDMTLLGTGMRLANPVTFDVGTCGGVLTGNPGDTSFSFSGGSLAPTTTCTLTLRVVMTVNGNLTNRIPAGTVTTFNGVSNPDPTEASLTNLPGVSVIKSFSPAQVLTNQPSTLTIVVSNTSNVPVVGMGVADNLPGTLPDGLEVANPANETNTCGGTLTAIPGAQTIQLVGGGLTAVGTPGAICTLTVDVISTRPGVYVNTIPAGSIVSVGGVTNNDPTTDTLTVTSNYSLGNRVWYDTNNNGAIDFGAEVGIPNVRVQLFNAAGTEINVGPDGILGNGDDAPGGMLTNATGYYRFDNLPAGDYTVRIPNDNFSVGGTTDALVGYWSSGTTIDASGVPSDATANDPDTDVDDSDENGITTLSGNATNFVASAVVTLGPGSFEPLNESDLSGGQGAADGYANMTVDFGFYRQTLGDLVFVDNNGDGAYDAGDTPLQNAVVQLYSSNGTEINVGPDGIFGTNDDAAGGVTTGVGGTYQFSGLPQGDYIVRVTPPVGYTSTVDTADSADTTDPDTNTDNNDNGGGTGIGQASSGIVTLPPGQGTGGSAGAANNIVTQSTGSTSDPTVDFGFVTNNGAVTKNIIGTNETFTSGTDVAIGEVVTYEVVVNLPIGTPLTNVTVTDRMDKGLAFVECILVEVAGVNQTPIVCPAPPPIPPAQPVVSSITNPGDLPGNPANPGRQVVFTIGNIPAQSGATTLRIQYRAIVLNVLENQENVTLNNSVTWAFTGGSFTTSSPNVEIIEPDLSIDKSAIPNTGVAIGTPIQFSLTINHTVLSSVDAFDVVVTDILPPELEYIPCSITYTGLAPTTPPAPAYCPGATSNLIFEWDVFPLGATATITFNARLVNAPAANTANVAWTSLPIDPGPGGLPVQLSPHNTESTERWYDPLDDVNIYAVFDTVTINAPPTGGTTTDDEDASIPNILPKTGFAPNRVTVLPEQPAEKMYSNTDVWLEVPRLRLTMPIVGVPIVGEDWDVSWLWNEAGWLEGTAFPSWQGNSVLTSHVTLSNGEEGPFAKLGELKYGDRIIVHAYGESFIYEVRQNRTVKPGNTSVLQHEDKAWLTLLTCKTYNEATDTYADRIAVRAVLIGSAEDKTSSRTNIR